LSILPATTRRETFMADDDTDRRITLLEMKVAEQERTIEELSAQIAGQWSTIERMGKKLDALTTRFLALEEHAAPAPEITRPPHW
jgi:SlyX protein